jgi:Mg-chelatase subunit ChlD
MIAKSPTHSPLFRNNMRSTLFIFCLIVLCTGTTLSQVAVYPKKIDYGIVTFSTDRVVDIIVSNPKDKAEYLLRIENSHELDVIFSSKTIEPNGQITIRVKLNPRNTGSFSEDLKLYFGSLPVPIVVPIRAQVDYLDPKDNIPCPSFANRAADCCPSNMFLVEVVDKKTGKSISNAEINISQDGKTIKKFLTRSEGMATQSIDIAYYSIEAFAKGYKSQKIYSYINSQNNHFVFELDKDPNVIIEEESAPDSTSVSENELMPESLYKPNNIVFLIDVSTSMSTGEKMELAKLAMNHLAGALRPIDIVALISYAGDTEVLIENSGASNREEIIQVVNEMKAYGMTAGANGFKRAFQMIKKYEIENGNNQLIVITDGAFKTSDQESINKLVKRYARRQYKTSIIGIKANNYATENLKEVSSLGSGTYVSVETEKEAESAILEEIKKQSSKR